MKRSLTSETPRKKGKKVKIAGWVDTRRNHGKIVFFDVRDRGGLVQVVWSPQIRQGADAGQAPTPYETAQKIRPEWVVEIEGTVQARPENLKNPKLATGDIEIAATKLTVLAESKTLPLPIDTDGSEIGEDARLKYRYLDLRRARLQRNLQIRSQYVQAARAHLFSKGFLEIETPLLTKSTPEGSRDFVVPSRVYPGKFYALAQSPQQYKQLLMIGGFEKYFQIARALRDEDPRADRAFEHTQIDIEMSFVQREDVMGLVEGMTREALSKIGAKIAPKPFPVMTYEQAMKKYATDKPDLRTEQEKKAGVLRFVWITDFPFFEKDEQGAWTFTHNPFSAPLSEEHEKWLLAGTHIENILTSQYDLVCNGLEVSGGSMRTNKPEVLRAIFRVLGYSQERIEKEFGHMLQAFEYGAPPHGGCAQGFERLLMAYLLEERIGEVQAFPQTGQGRTSVMDAPTELTQDQLRELHLRIQKENDTKNRDV